MSPGIRIVALAVLSSLLAVCPLAQTPAASSEDRELDREMALLRKRLRSEQIRIFGANLTMTAKEAENFWPMYERYADEVAKMVDVKYALMKQYAQNGDTLSDEMADKTAKEWLMLDQSLANLRLKYLPIFRGILPAKSTARFYQIERRLTNLIELKVASIVPWVQP